MLEFHEGLCQKMLISSKEASQLHWSSAMVKLRGWKTGVYGRPSYFIALEQSKQLIGNRQIPVDWWTSGKNYSIQFFWLVDYIDIYIYVSDPVKSCYISYIILNHHVWFWNPPFWTGHIWRLPSGQAVADGLKNVAQHHIRSEAGTGHGSQLVLWFHTCMCIHTPKKVMNNHNENTKSSISIWNKPVLCVYRVYLSYMWKNKFTNSEAPPAGSKHFPSFGARMGWKFADHHPVPRLSRTWWVSDMSPPVGDFILKCTKYILSIMICLDMTNCFWQPSPVYFSCATKNPCEQQAVGDWVSSELCPEVLLQSPRPLGMLSTLTFQVVWLESLTRKRGLPTTIYGCSVLLAPRRGFPSDLFPCLLAGHGACRSLKGGHWPSGPRVQWTQAAWWFGTCLIFPFIGNHTPIWLIFFGGVETTNQQVLHVFTSTGEGSITLAAQWLHNQGTSRCGCET